MRLFAGNRNTTIFGLLFSRPYAIIFECEKRRPKRLRKCAAFSPFHAERWLSWSKAHDWKSCVPFKGTESSNLSLSAKKQGAPFRVLLVFGALFGRFEGRKRKRAGILDTSSTARYQWDPLGMTRFLAPCFRGGPTCAVWKTSTSMPMPENRSSLCQKDIIVRQGEVVPFRVQACSLIKPIKLVITCSGAQK